MNKEDLPRWRVLKWDEELYNWFTVATFDDIEYAELYMRNQMKGDFRALEPFYEDERDDRMYLKESKKAKRRQEALDSQIQNNKSKQKKELKDGLKYLVLSALSFLGAYSVSLYYLFYFLM